MRYVVGCTRSGSVVKPTRGCPQTATPPAQTLRRNKRGLPYLLQKKQYRYNGNEWSYVGSKQRTRSTPLEKKHYCATQHHAELLKKTKHTQTAHVRKKMIEHHCVTSIPPCSFCQFRPAQRVGVVLTRACGEKEGESADIYKGCGGRREGVRHLLLACPVGRLFYSCDHLTSAPSLSWCSSGSSGRQQSIATLK